MVFKSSNKNFQDNIDPVDAYIGSRIKKKRVLLSMTQKRLGKIINVSFQQIQKYEKGVNSLNCKRLLEISIALKTSILYFFEGLERDKESGYQGLAENSYFYNPYVETDHEELISNFSSIKDPRICEKSL